MPIFTYVVKYEHGSAEGTVTADTSKEAEAKAKAMYDGLQFDTLNKKGEPTVGITKVTDVKVTKEV